jgi:putative transcriptional regulator
MLRARARVQRQYENGLIAEDIYKKQMQLTADAINLPKPEPYTGVQIKELRESLFMSQAVFADVIGAKKDTVSKWERGEGSPRGMVFRLFHVLKKSGLQAIL